MHTLEPELRALHAEGVIDGDTAARALARDRGAVFSLHAELRAALYAGVLLVMGGLGIVLARNLDRVGPLAIVAAIAFVAAACVVPALRAKLAGHTASVAGAVTSSAWSVRGWPVAGSAIAVASAPTRSDGYAVA